MKKAGTDPKVKKTLVRNYEQKVRKEREKVIHDVDASSSKSKFSAKSSRTQNENELDQPSLCTSEALARYLVEAKKSLSPLQPEDLNIDKEQLTAKMTKKLNFHFNDRIYKNLVELNADAANNKNKKDKKVVKSSSGVKKDLEPNIDDFCNDEKELDIPPQIPVIKPKFKPVREVDNGQLHRLVASFECL